MGGSGRILRPAQPPFLCHRPLDGRMPSQRFRPAFPITRLLWSALETLPTVTIHVSNTCGEKAASAHELPNTGLDPIRPLSWSNRPEVNIKRTWIWCLDGSWTMAVPFTFLSSTPHVPADTHTHTESAARSRRPGVPAGQCCTCGADVLRSLLREQLQVIDQRADGKSAQRMRVSLFGQNRHASDRAGRPDQVSGLHVLCGDDPALTASAGDQSDIGRSDGGEDAGEERSERSGDLQDHH